VVRVSSRVVDDVVQHARQAAPEEACGLLIGARDLVQSARPARNVAERPLVRFLIDPRDHFDAFREARRHGLDVVGYYHSHPRSSAVPSDVDRAEANDPDHLHLIVGLATDPADVRLFHVLDGAFLDVPLVTVD
jgi:proteasome lid subunit RPN8/RPN11